MDNSCILGADFLKYGKMLVDVADAKLSWPSGEVPLRVETTTPSTNRLSALLESTFMCSLMHRMILWAELHKRIMLSTQETVTLSNSVPTEKC